MRIPTGALTERNFRLLFTSATISGVGDGISIVALAFAVLQVSHNSPVVLGGVIAARQVANAAITLAAGVWADRFRRDLLLVGAGVVQGFAQTATGVLVLHGSGSVALLVGCQAVYGLAEGFVIPASTGLIPATVSAGRLQQANALLGLSQNGTRILGPAIGGALVYLGTPGGALSYWVLGPVIAKHQLGGAPAWAAVSAANAVGALVGGGIALRIRPRKPLAASCMSAWLFLLPPLGFGLGLPLPVLIVFSAISGTGIAVHR